MNILTKSTLDKGNTPKDILMLRRFIENEGIEEYEKNSLNFLSEFLNTYIADLLSDSKQYMMFAERNKMNIDDVKLAVKLRQSSFYTKKPEVSILKDLAKEVNTIPLPNIPDTPHILLPPPEHSLVRNNFQIYSEEIYQNFHNPKPDAEQSNFENKIEEDIAVGKKQTMIGLKRKDIDKNERDKDKPSILNKKRLRLSAHHEGEDIHMLGHKIINSNIGNNPQAFQEKEKGGSKLNKLSFFPNEYPKNSSMGNKKDGESVDDEDEALVQDDSMEGSQNENNYRFHNDNHSDMDEFRYDGYFP